MYTLAFHKHTSFNLPTGIEFYYNRGQMYMSDGRLIVPVTNLDLNLRLFSSDTAYEIGPLLSPSNEIVDIQEVFAHAERQSNVPIVEALHARSKVYLFNKQMVVSYTDGLCIITDGLARRIPMPDGTKAIVAVFTTAEYIFVIYESYNQAAYERNHTYQVYRYAHGYWYEVANLCLKCPLFLCHYAAQQIYYIDRGDYTTPLELFDLNGRVVADLGLTHSTVNSAHILSTGQLVVQTFRQRAEVHIYE